MLKRFNEIRSHLLEVADNEGATVAIDRSSGFKLQAERFADMLGEIDEVTRDLQGRTQTLSDCRYAVDTLISEIEHSKEDPESKLYGCRLKTKYISIDSGRSLDNAFEAGVVKIQRGAESTLSVHEKAACQKLLATRNPSRGNTAVKNLTMRQKIASNKAKKSSQEGVYVNCGFILGTVAEVERLWSIGGNVYRDNRMRMSPILFESVLFLKVNKSYWDLGLVSEAMKSTRSESVVKRLAEDGITCQE